MWGNCFCKACFVAEAKKFPRKSSFLSLGKFFELAKANPPGS